MKNKNVLLLFFLLVSFSLSAQQYKSAIGVRGGVANGITYKQFISEKGALEGIASFRWRGFEFTGLYEHHYPVFDPEGFFFYWGAGGHIGFYNGDQVRWADDNLAYTVIGADGMIGLEYNFQDIPLNLSVDWKPAINFIGYTGFWPDGGGISARYIIGR